MFIEIHVFQLGVNKPENSVVDAKVSLELVDYSPIASKSVMEKHSTENSTLGVGHGSLAPGFHMMNQTTTGFDDLLVLSEKIFLLFFGGVGMQNNDALITSDCHSSSFRLVSPWTNAKSKD